MGSRYLAHNGDGSAASAVILAGGGRGLQTALGPMRSGKSCSLSGYGPASRRRSSPAAGCKALFIGGARPRSAPSHCRPSCRLHVRSHARFALLKGVDTTLLRVPLSFQQQRLAYGLAFYEERYNSIAPALAAHIGFNVGGAIGGVLFVITYESPPDIFHHK